MSSNFVSGPTRLMIVAVQSLLTDGEFQQPSPEAIATLQGIKALVKLWNGEPQNHQPPTTFYGFKLKTCFQTKAKFMHLKKKKWIWGKYYQLHTLSDFKLERKKFLEAPIAITYVQHIIFRTVVLRIRDR